MVVVINGVCLQFTGMSGRYWDGLDKNRQKRDTSDRDRGHRRRSRSRDRDRHRRRYSRSISRSRSRSRSRYDRERRRHHKSQRSSSTERHHHREKQREERPHQNGDSKSTSKNPSLATSHTNDKSSESTQDGFDFASTKQETESNTQYIGGIESEEERKKIHEQMQERLRKLKESEPKRIVPTKPTSLINATPFANDGSFLEKFKEMQERFAQQQETQQREDDRLRLLPMVGRRRGGKILKTGIVEKPKRIEDNPGEGPKDAWSLYLQEVKRYKNATCDPDAPSRSLVK